MTKTEKRMELLSSALTHLQAVAKLLQEAEEEVLADEAGELADKVDVVAIGEDVVVLNKVSNLFEFGH